MARKGTLTVKLVGDDSRLQRTLDGVGGKVASFAKAAAAAGGAAAVAFGVEAVRGAVELNETLSKTNEVFGAASDKVVGFADDMASAFGLPKQEILDAASNIGLVAQASGLAEGAAADMSVEMAQLAADAASFYNVPLDQALEKIRSGLVGEAEPLRAFGVLLSAAAVEAKAVELGIAAVGEELSEEQKVMARSAIITEQMSTASGDLERTQDSLANRVRELKGRFQNFAAEVGQHVIPKISELWDWLERVLPPALDVLKQAWNENGDAIMATVSNLGDIVVSLGGIIADVMGGASDDVDTSADGISDSLGTIADGLETVSGAIAAVMGAVDRATDFMDTPFGRFLSDMFSMMTSIVDVFENAMETYRELQSALGNTKAVGPAFEKTKPSGSAAGSVAGVGGFTEFHGGGMVSRGGLANLAAKERVLDPRQTAAFERMVDMLDGGGTGGTVVVKIGDETIARVVLDALSRERRRNGTATAVI